MQSVRSKGGDAEQASIRYFSLPGQLPEGHILALNVHLGLLSYLYLDEQKTPRLLGEQQFSVNEMRVLVPLLEQYPHFCPYEIMLASFTYGQVTETTIASAGERLHEAQFAGTWDYEMRPVRNILSRARFKLKDLGIDIRSILETGYMLKNNVQQPVPEEGSTCS